MGNIVTREPKFKIKNDTLFPIYVMLTQVKYKLATDNIQPGLRVSTFLNMFMLTFKCHFRETQ